jgi:hypothetical protein
MAATVTIATLITRVRRLSDTVGSGHIDDAEIIDYLSTEYTMLYDLLVEAFGATYFSTKECITYSKSTHKAQLPDDFYKLWMLGECRCSGYEDLTCPAPDGIKRMQSYDWDAQWLGAENWMDERRLSNYKYTIKQGWLELLPEPPDGFQMCCEYVPAPAPLAAGSTVDGVNGFEDYIAAGAAMRVAIHEGIDTSSLQQLQAKAWQRILAAAPSRDLLEPKTVRLTFSASDWGDYDY